jgi:hypothetical protein
VFNKDVKVPLQEAELVGTSSSNKSFNILIGLFERISLFTNVSKTKVMSCIPGRTREAYTGEQYAKYKSPTGAAANNKRRRIDCEICGTSLAPGSYQSHLESQHDVF